MLRALGLPNVQSVKSSHIRRSFVCCNSTVGAAGVSNEKFKSELLKAVSGTKRGRATTKTQRAEILSVITQVEATNTQPDPALSPLLSGVWALLYQAPVDEKKAEIDKSGTTEGPFLAAFQPFTKDLVRTKANLQLIDLPNERVENLAEFVIADRWDGALNIVGSGKVAPPVEGLGSVRVNVEFQKFELRIGSWGPWTIPLDWVKPKGWVQTTYLDSDLRVGRGDKGSVFVAARAKGSRWLGVGGSSSR